jgi:hypothetical protein
MSAKGVLRTGVCAAMVALGLPLSAAKADVVCSQYGDCWRTRERYDIYPAELGVQFYSDDWYSAHRRDPNYHLLRAPRNDYGYYVRGSWKALDREKGGQGH